MINHSDLGANAGERRRKMRMLIVTGKIRLGGNKMLKIYGTLSCMSGKRMNVENRIFFETEEEAIHSGYRPCGHCMTTKYKEWKTRRT